LHPHQKTIHAFFMSDKLREELQKRSEACMQMLDPSRKLAQMHPHEKTCRILANFHHVKDPDYQKLPAELSMYHSLYPLDATMDISTKVFGYPTWVYKATGAMDGKFYVLRRIEGTPFCNFL
jgi:PAB-dependent poly(A)-specific ribonuclease subunit 3